MDSITVIANTLGTLAVQAFGTLVQLIVYVLDFFLVIARVILTVLHLS